MQIHCFDAATLDKEYTVVTNPVIPGFSGFGSIGVGPLALGPRWMAYSGSPITISNSGHVSPQHVTPSDSLPSSATNGSLFAHYAKESSKQLAGGIVTLGIIGYKKLTRHYSDLSPDGNSSQSRNARLKIPGTDNGHFPGAESVGMVQITLIDISYLTVNGDLKLGLHVPCHSLVSISAPCCAQNSFRSLPHLI